MYIVVEGLSVLSVAKDGTGYIEALVQKWRMKINTIKMKVS
jgi:hypothetical protein